MIDLLYVWIYGFQVKESIFDSGVLVFRPCDAQLYASVTVCGHYFTQEEYNLCDKIGRNISHIGVNVVS